MQETTDSDNRRLSLYDDETPLREYLLVLWSRRWLLLAVSLACGLAALAVGMTGARIYEASVTITVSPPKTTQVGEVASPISVTMVRAIAESQSIAAKLVKEFGLDAEPTRLSPQAFRGGALVVEAPRETNMVIARVRLARSDLPARVANRLAELAIQDAQRQSKEETARTGEYIKAQVNQAAARLGAIQARLREFQQRAQIEALRGEVDAELAQRADLIPLEIDIAAERASLTRAEDELVERSRNLQPRSGTAKSGGASEGRETKLDSSTPVDGNLEDRIAERRTRIAGLEKRRAELLAMRKSALGQSAKLNLLYSREAELDRLEGEYELARRIYLDVSYRHEQIALQAEAPTPQLQLSDPALPPDRPIGRPVLRNVIVAGIGGAILAAFAVLFLAVLNPPLPPIGPRHTRDGQ